MTPCDQDEMGGGSTRPPSQSRKNTVDANKEAVEVESLYCLPSLDVDKRMCSQPDSEREEEEQVEQPGRQLACLQIPDFLLPDAPEGNSGK